ncbi:MAG: hypothetical protein SGJ03_01840 [Alphaproteobacteria bacterium]|nr:hypothetical protein [Alphaproteobacteria bacterium]
MRLTALLAATAITAATSISALAVEVRDCDWAASAQSLAEPWEKNTKVFGNGAVRIALIDTGSEPVCCSMQLLILAENKTDEQGNRMCRLVGDKSNLGFESIDFLRLTASYDPRRGLLLTFPYTLYVDGLSHRKGVARIRVNSARGTIRPE